MINKTYKAMQNAWLFLPLAIFYFQVLKYLANVPAWDDYNMPLEWILKMKHATFAEQLQLFWFQYNEHRLLPSKLLYWTYYKLTGTINFRIIGIIGSLQLIPVALIGANYIRKLLSPCQQWSVTIVKVFTFIWFLLVFDLNTYENACMCMYAVANYGTICYFVIAMWCWSTAIIARHDAILGKKWWWMVAAILFQLTCAFSNANGLWGSIVISAYVWFRYRAKGMFLISANLTIAALILHFGTSNTETVHQSPFDLGKAITFFIRESGAHFSFDFSLIFGLAVLVLTLRVLPLKRLKTMSGTVFPFLFIWLFAIGTMGLAAIFRSQTADAQFQTSRYLIYPQLVLGCLLIFAFQRWGLAYTWKPKWLNVAVPVIMTIAYMKNAHFGLAGFERTNIRATMIEYWHPQPEQAAKIAKQTCDEGVYCIEENR